MHFQDKGSWYLGRRLEGEVDGYFIQIQVFSEPSQYGIGKGKISRLVIYPNRQCSFKDKMAYFDRGWDGGPPADSNLRKAIDKTVRHFDGKSVDWSQEG
jgi:hypothetical protein